MRLFKILFSLSLLLFPLGAFPAEVSEDRHYVFAGKPVDDRKTDLTSDYIDVHFSGIIKTEALPGECRYEIPRLTVKLLKVKNRLTKSITVDGVQFIAANYSKSFTFVRLYPHVALLPSPDSSIDIENVRFSISKDILKKSDYVGLSLSGTVLMQDDGRYAKAGLQTRMNLFIKGRHAIWPITPANEKFQDEGEFDFKIIRQPPQSPDDLCSSAKLM